MILPDLKEERKFLRRKIRYIAGVDEVGRGALAGPVVAATVLLLGRRGLEDDPPPIPVRDSKRLNQLQRERLDRWLRQNPAFMLSTVVISPRRIDKLNIRRASLLAMAQSVVSLKRRPRALLVDGIDSLPLRIRQHTYIKGDSRIFLIALASIVAKVRRDALMVKLAKRYPNYGFEVHKGYGTKSHRLALKQRGPSPVHRISFL